MICGNDAEVRRYNYPRGPLIARMEWPFEGDDQIGDFMAFVDTNRALLTSTNGRLFLVDLTKMAIVEELSFHGHEPKPVEEFYPSLIGDRGLCSDLAFFLRLSHDRFLSVPRTLPSPDPDDSHDLLMTWRVD